MAREPMKQALARQAGRAAVVAAMMLFGFTLIVVSWFGVAGEVDFLAQVPWITGGAIPGALFVGLGAMIAATRDSGRYVGRVQGLSTRLEAMHRVIASEAGVAASHEEIEDLVITSNGVTFHLPGCPLTHGKARETVAREDLPDGLTPCRLCEPA